MSEKFALVSVSDKTGIEGFARMLSEAGYRILSTGGTARRLRDHDVEVTQVSDVTGFPEIMDGRVKTLHPKIHGGLLARRDVEAHVDTMEKHGIPDIQVVVVNLYPFKKVISREDVTLEEAVENIDIGGPCMLRAAAKNFRSQTVVVDPADYSRVAEALLGGGTSQELRAELALKAFRHTADYDAAISDFLAADDEPVPALASLQLGRTEVLRYGENPHQAAALYTPEGALPYGGLEQLHGKPLSYNNIVDLDAALAIVAEFDEPAAAVIKHTNPAGCATHSDIATAFRDAHACDPMSSFGGIVTLNRSVDRELAETLHESYFEIIAAPAFDGGALEVLQQKKNIRLMVVPADLAFPTHDIRATALGHLLQEADPRIAWNPDEMEVPTERAPTDEEWAALHFAWKVCKHVKSNAIVLGKGTKTIGVGAGQMSRVDAVELAVKKCRSEIAGGVLASDAFFPFRDGPDAAAEAGITAIVQPGGSRRDSEVIEACDEHGLTMVFTGHRHFRH